MSAQELSESELDPALRGSRLLYALEAFTDDLITTSARNAMHRKDEKLQVTKFCCSYAPDVTIFQYLQRIRQYSNCSNACFVIALVYIDRAVNANYIFLTKLNVHRIILTAVLLATKFLDDTYYNNSFYAKLGGIPSDEMNSLEIEMLCLTRFHLNVSADEFMEYSTNLCTYSAQVQAKMSPETLAEIDCADKLASEGRTVAAQAQADASKVAAAHQAQSSAVAVAAMHAARGTQPPEAAGPTSVTLKAKPHTPRSVDDGIKAISPMGDRRAPLTRVPSMGSVEEQALAESTVLDVVRTVGDVASDFWDAPESSLVSATNVAQNADSSLHVGATTMPVPLTRYQRDHHHHQQQQQQQQINHQYYQHHQQHKQPQHSYNLRSRQQEQQQQYFMQQQQQQYYQQQQQYYEQQQYHPQQLTGSYGSMPVYHQQQGGIYSMPTSA